jgi:organic radical activating enzyme
MTKKLIRIEASYPKLLKIYYDLGNVCNYKCWYCFPGSNEGTSSWPNATIVKKNLVTLINYYLSTGVVNEIELHFLGGEPTLWPKLSEVIEYVTANSTVKIHMLTNGSRTMRWWRENAKFFDFIGISVHHESADVDHLIELGNFLYSSGIKFHTSVLMDHTNWNKSIDVLNRLTSTKKKWLVLSKPIHINGVVNYDADQSKFLHKHIKRWPAIKDWLKFLLLKRRSYKAFYSDGSTVKTNSDNYFLLTMANKYQGWECTLGINYLFIDRKGNLTGTCNQHLYGLNYYFNINAVDFSKTFSPEIKTVTCDRYICTCPGESALTKWKKS